MDIVSKSWLIAHICCIEGLLYTRRSLVTNCGRAVNIEGVRLYHAYVDTDVDPVICATINIMDLDNLAYPLFLSQINLK